MTEKVSMYIHTESPSAQRQASLVWGSWVCKRDSWLYVGYPGFFTQPQHFCQSSPKKGISQDLKVFHAPSAWLLPQEQRTFLGVLGVPTQTPSPPGNPGSSKL